MAGDAQKLLGHLLRLTDGAISDATLLARWTQSKDEEAFAALVARHGPMVLGVCQRVLGDWQLAEDAFQATFLVLAHKAGGIRPPEALAAYLYGVASRAARKASRARRWKIIPGCRGTVEPADPQPHALDVLSGRELLAMVAAEVARLPKVYRLPVLLCVLQERSVEEAARILDCSMGAVRGRLARGRQMLRERLARRGLTPSGGALALLAPAKVPHHLLSATLRNLTNAAPGAVNALAAGSSLGLAIRVLCVACLVSAVGVASGWPLLRTPGPRTAVMAAPAVPIKQESRRDIYDDPLPENALARLGTLRLRHGNPIELLNFAPDGKTLLSADWHGIHGWDAISGKHLRRFGDLDGRQFQSISVSADNRTAALSMSNGAIEIWDANKGQYLRQFQAARFPHVELSPDGKLLAVCDLEIKGRGKEVQNLRLLDAFTGVERHRLVGHQDTIHTFLFSGDSKMLITCSDDKSIRLWDTNTGKQVRQLNHSAPVGHIFLATDGKTLASVAVSKHVGKGPDGRIRSVAWLSVNDIVLWDLATGKEIRRLAGRKNDTQVNQHWIGGVHSVFFTPDSKVLISSDWATHWWDVATGKEIREGNVPLDQVSVLAFSPDGRTMAAAWHTAIQLWDRTTGKQKQAGAGHQSPVWAVAISPDGRTFATAGQDKDIRLWDSVSGQMTRRSAAHPTSPRSLAFVSNKRLLVSTSDHGKLDVLGTDNGECLRSFPGNTGALSPDGKLLTTDCEDKHVRFWEFDTGHELRKCPSHGIEAMAFSPDGRVLLSYEKDKKVHIRDVATVRELRRFEGHHFRRDKQDRIYHVALSPDGKLVGFGGAVNEIALYDVTTGKQVKELRCTSGGISSFTFSPDSRLLAGGDWYAGVVQIWEVATGEEIRQFIGHKGRILDIAFSADSRRLLTGSDDTTALVWDVTGRHGLPLMGRLSDEDMNACWADLAGPDAGRAFRARWALASSPAQSLTFLENHLKPIKQPEAKRLTDLLADLSSSQFTTRARAQAELEQLEEAAEPALQQALRGDVPLEVRQRVQRLLNRLHQPIPTPEMLRSGRALAVLEDIGAQPARKLLQALASGAPAARLTREAQASLDRFRRRADFLP